MCKNTIYCCKNNTLKNMTGWTDYIMDQGVQGGGAGEIRVP